MKKKARRIWSILWVALALTLSGCAIPLPPLSLLPLLVKDQPAKDGRVSPSTCLARPADEQLFGKKPGAVDVAQAEREPGAPVGFDWTEIRERESPCPDHMNGVIPF